MGLFSRFRLLLSPKSLLEAIFAKQIEVKATLALSFVFIIDLFILIPLLLIVAVKILLIDPSSLLVDSLYITFTVLLIVPVITLFLDATIIFLSLKLVSSSIGYSRCLLSRTVGLVPLVLMIPLKALVTNPYTLVPSFFWPPFTGLIVSLTSSFVNYPPEIAGLAITLNIWSLLRIIITAITILWTFKRTVGSLAKLGEINTKPAVLASLIQLIFFEIIALFVAVTFSLNFL